MKYLNSYVANIKSVALGKSYSLTCLLINYLADHTTYIVVTPCTVLSGHKKIPTSPSLEAYLRVGAK